MQVDINLVIALFELRPKRPMKGLKAVAGFVSSNASRRPGWLTSPSGQVLSLRCESSGSPFPSSTS